MKDTKRDKGESKGETKTKMIKGDKTNTHEFFCCFFYIIGFNKTDPCG